jgi:hypothetical protein
MGVGHRNLIQDLELLQRLVPGFFAKGEWLALLSSTSHAKNNRYWANKVSVYIHCLKKAKPDAAPKHMGDGKFRHRRIDRAARSVLTTDFSDRSMWVTECSVTLMYWACLTLKYIVSLDYISLWGRHISPATHLLSFTPPPPQKRLFWVLYLLG